MPGGKGVSGDDITEKFKLLSLNFVFLLVSSLYSFSAFVDDLIRVMILNRTFFAAD